MQVLPLNNESTCVGQLAQQRLHESPYYFLKNISCDFQGGVLTLRGRVPFGELKDFAEVIASRVPGVVDVVNRVEVIDPMRPISEVPTLRTAG